MSYDDRPVGGLDGSDSPRGDASDRSDARLVRRVMDRLHSLGERVASYSRTWTRRYVEQQAQLYEKSR